MQIATVPAGLQWEVNNGYKLPAAGFRCSRSQARKALLKPLQQYISEAAVLGRLASSSLQL